jgi:hypothetical protein
MGRCPGWSQVHRLKRGVRRGERSGELSFGDLVANMKIQCGGVGTPINNKGQRVGVAIGVDD